MAPNVEPLLKNPVAKARSLAGNHSETAFTPPGQFPASPMPNRNRNTPNDRTELAAACSMAATLHQPTVSAMPTRVPNRSIKRPEPLCMIM